tara:strand:- start:2368 stop:2718 length:351 start_codon:yes stop_codon:yes gene_type:complete
MTSMPHNYKKMPEIWRIEELFSLSDKYPSGLEWIVDKAGYKKGDQAGKINKKNGYYFVSIDNESYMVHRIVYYLRTGQCPDRYSIKHSFSNRNKDNRLDLNPSYLPYPQKKLTAHV